MLNCYSILRLLSDNVVTKVKLHLSYLNCCSGYQITKLKALSKEKKRLVNSFIHNHIIKNILAKLAHFERL